MNLCLHGEAILPDRTVPDAYVSCQEGRITGIVLTKPAGVPVLESRYIAPGFIDLHVHGGAGSDYMDGTLETVRAANRAHARHGTTTIFPTTTTGSPVEIGRMLDACSEAKQTWSIADGARVGGVHYYGPYFAAEKVGCHPVEGRRDPDAAEYEQVFARDIVRVATCAAELPGAAAFYQAARQSGCLVTCGHSDSTWTEMQRAYDTGMRHVDHFWCAMSSVASLRARYGTPMQASMEQFVLAHPEMSTEVIADGRHLAPELLEFAFRMKGPERLCLVTDANRALDMPPGHYRFGPQDTGSWFESDGTVGFAGTGLASSVVGMDTMVRHMAASTSAGLYQVVRMASLTPAERSGIDADTGSIEVGKRADLLLLDETLQVSRVFVGGEEFGSNPNQPFRICNSLIVRSDKSSQ